MAEIYLHHRKDKRLYASVYRSVFSPGSHNHQPKISFEIVLMNVGFSKRNTCELSLSWLIYIYISQTLVVSLFFVCNCVNS